MSIPTRLALAVAGLSTTTAATAQQAGSQLFSSDDVLQLTMQAPFGAIAGNRNDDKARPGTLTLGGRAIAVGLAPRGITRRASDICDFPPLRVDFRGGDVTGTPFEGQRRLKLVTHCRRSANHQQHVLLEFAAYRIYNLLTPLSFRARLASIDYRDQSGKPLATRYGFFIEDLYHVGQRNGFTQAKTGDRISSGVLAPAEAGRAAIFQYMIGNLDFSMRAGPEGEGCCHNFRLLQKGTSPSLVPVPYDFDFSGFVDAPYATPPAQIDVSSVRVRRYRGYCSHNAHALRAAAELRAKRGDVAAIIASLPGIAPATVRKASAYLDGFWRQIGSDEAVQANVLKDCVG